MRTRTKLWICVGLLTVTAGVVMVCSRSRGQAGTVSFVSYTNSRTAVLTFTNMGNSPVLCVGLNVTLFSEDDRRSAVRGSVVFPRSATQLVAQPQPLPSFSGLVLHSRAFGGANKTTDQWPVHPVTVSVQCVPQPSKLRQDVEFVLRKVGISIVDTGFVAMAALPAR